MSDLAVATDDHEVEWSGLTAAEVAQRHDRGEDNAYTAPTSRTVRQILRANICTRFNALLGSLLAVILIVGPLQDALFGLTLVANTAVGVFQELRAKRTLDRLTVVAAPKVTVTRDGAKHEVPSRELVLDDLVHVHSGDQVAVDGVVVHDSGALFDESLLTGESHAVAKDVGDLVRSGSFVTAGSARFRATAVGAESYAAKLAAQARQFTLARSELRDGINRMLQVITWVLIPVAALLIWSQFNSGSSVADAARASVAGTVVMVPEGLVLLASIAFAVGAVRLARRQVLSRELPSIEGLARVDTLCIDKTGTLTTGRLTVTDVAPLGADISEPTAALGALAWLETQANATALALQQQFARPDGWTATSLQPFDSTNKWSGGCFGTHGWWVLGAPEVLSPYDASVQSRVNDLAASGARVLLLARGRPSDSAHSVQPAALVTLIDEIRPDAQATLAYLDKQGVAVKVISGDHPGTVAALARRVGIDEPTPIDARALHSEADLAAAVEQHNIFGRVTPEQKQFMVNALRANGHVVAMTGDGVNDLLALKDSDVGIAMGAGAPATRAVAQLVLLDNSFAAVPAVIGEGRRVIANVERVANLFITKTVYATVLAVAVGIARLPFPFLPRHLTLVSTLTIGIPAFFLALAPNESRARPHFLARVVRFAVPAGLIAAGATYLTYEEARDNPGTSLTEARTLATIVLAAVALWILAILIRLGQSGGWLVPAMSLALVATLAMPWTRQFFALSFPSTLLLLAGVGVAALSGFTLELGWKVVGWLRPVVHRERS